MTCNRATTGSDAVIVGTGSATRYLKLARKRLVTTTGKTWRAAWEAAVELRWTGCSCGGSLGFPETDWAFSVLVAVGDIVTGSTRGIWVDVVDRVVVAVMDGALKRGIGSGTGQGSSNRAESSRRLCDKIRKLQLDPAIMLLCILPCIRPLHGTEFADCAWSFPFPSVFTNGRLLTSAIVCPGYRMLEPRQPVRVSFHHQYIPSTKRVRETERVGACGTTSRTLGASTAESTFGEGHHQADSRPLSLRNWVGMQLQMHSSVVQI